MTDAAIYKHFTSKDEVALAAFAHYSNLYARLIDAHVQNRDSFGSGLDSLILDILRQHEKYRFGLPLPSRRHEMFTRLTAIHRLPIATMTDFIQSGIDSGEIPTQSARHAVTLIMGAFTRLAVLSDFGGLPNVEFNAPWWAVIFNLVTHNVYHIGQIVYVKKITGLLG